MSVEKLQAYQTFKKKKLIISLKISFWKIIMKQINKINLNPKKNLLDTQHEKTFKAKQWLKIQFYTT